MAIRFKLGKMSPLQPDETVLHTQDRFRAVSGTCLPSYHIEFQLPPLWKITLWVTNRRCLVVTDLFHTFTEEIDMWYPGMNPEGATDLISSVSVRRGLFGKCLEIRSRDPRRSRRWLCSPNMTLRFFFQNPEDVESVIRGAMNRNEAGNEALQPMV